MFIAGIRGNGISGHSYAGYGGTGSFDADQCGHHSAYKQLTAGMHHEGPFRDRSCSCEVVAVPAANLVVLS